MRENRNIAAWLPRMAASHGDMACVVVPHRPKSDGRTSYSFAELEQESNLIAAGLENYGISRGARTALMVTPSLDFFALTFALFKLGAVPVFIDPGMGLKNLKQCLLEAQPSAFIGIPKAHLARIILRWPAVTHLVTVGARLGWGGINLQQVRALGQEQPWTCPVLSPEEDAAILFTSGSTGTPKGAIYTHGTFGAQVTSLKRLYNIQPGEVDLATFPLFALFAPALGMTAIVPDMDFTRPAMVNPSHIINLIRDHQVTNMFGSPALLNRVGRYGLQNGSSLPSLKRVISAGAPVPASTLETFSKLLEDDVEIFTPYGATESLPVASIGSNEILDETAALTARGKGVCVGKKVDEIELVVIRIDDRAIEHFSMELLVPQGAIGEIAVTGPMVTRSYFNREDSTKLSKMRGEDGRIWHRMGDLGYLDEQDRVWFCGRKAHRVPTNGGTLFSVPCEGIFNTHPAVFRTALVGVTDSHNKREPVLCVELEKKHVHANKESLRQELLSLGGAHELTRKIRIIYFHSGFPVDIRHNAKIFREKLAVWAARQ